MTKPKNEAIKKRFLFLSILVNLGILGAFKYYNFFIGETNNLFEHLNIGYAIPALSVLLPMGISFYTFQTMSYSIDVYNGRLKPEKHFGIFALFVSFFPQLVAGPIERASNLLPQFHEEKRFTYENAVWGINKIVYGLFKKVVVADTLGPYVDAVYSNINGSKPWELLFATLFFTFQIYCDFSGYSDIAIGSARIFGFDLMENFKRPYLSKSFSEFWQRWHISLSSWFRDYVYIPVGGNRVVKWRWYYNLLLTFLVSGFWHGAEWTFIIWGGLHGAYLILDATILSKFRSDNDGGLKLYLHRALTFILTVFAWIFFRANNCSDSFEVISKIGSIRDFSNLFDMTAGQGKLYFITCFLVIFMLLTSYVLPMHMRLKYPNLFWIFAIIVILIFGQNATSEFIYFQF